MKIFYFAFVNDPLEPIPQLKEESDKLYHFISGKLDQTNIQVHYEPYANLEKVNNFLRKHNTNISLFYFHSPYTNKSLLMESESEKTQALFQSLKLCSELNWMILDGSASKEVIKDLLYIEAVKGIISSSWASNKSLRHQFTMELLSSLVEKKDIESSYKEAKSRLQSMAPEINFIGIETLMFDILDPSHRNDPVWGLFLREEKKEFLKWKFPEKSVDKTPKSNQKPRKYIPNRILIENLFPLTDSHSPQTQVEIPEKRFSILNFYPLPIAGQIQKLVCPCPGSKKGFDKINSTRIIQMGRTYFVTMAYYSAILISQIWALKEKNPQLNLGEEFKASLIKFFNANQYKDNTFSFLQLITHLGQFYLKNALDFFLPESASFHTKIKNANSLYKACKFLEELSKEIHNKSFSEVEFENYCKQAEKELTILLKELAFLGKYSLATTRSIELIKFPHQVNPKQGPAYLNQIKFTGSKAVMHQINGWVDAYAVLLLKKTDNKTEILALSPFIIDNNAFEETETNIPDLFTLYQFDENQDEFLFYRVLNPDEPLLSISSFTNPMVKSNLDSFLKQMDIKY